MSENILDKFHPIVRTWFTRTFGLPSPPQQQGWPSISESRHTLIVAPTGSGKTLAAFLWCINHLIEENILFADRIANSEIIEPVQSPGLKKRNPHHPKKKTNTIGSSNPINGIRVLYISPLKALNNDIHRNLEIPLNGILNEAELQGIPLPEIRSAVRTGDTTQTERARMLKRPPDILITTPESLFLMLSSEKSRALFHSVRYVIVDEIHSISNTKRGVHLSLSLERLEHLVRNTRQAEHPESFVRIGLSATQKPLKAVAQFLGGMESNDENIVPRNVTIIDAGYKKNVDVKVICAVRDFADMPMDSIWSLVFPQILQLIHEHRTTLIFVNNRRLAERIAARLNELLEGTQDTTNNYAVPFYSNRPLPSEQGTSDIQNSESAFKVFAYHGSMSRTVREQLESDLKLGKLRVLITTSALELGIDIGTVDLVVQIQSPKGVARGLQRVGRSGHLVNAHSKGRIFVTHREDLIESAVVTKGMIEHNIEQTFIPQNCLDVLAQQIVAMVGIEDWNVDEIFDLIRHSYCYCALDERVFHSVLDMLAGRYTNDAFRELRARIMWNKLHNQLSSLPGSSLLAIMNAGTIPDRGYFGVYLEDLKTKVGEVDEEFIYESRAGDTFILGSNVWRMMDIDANKVIVSPAPGQPARMPFWRGEGIGRSYELGVRVGEFLEQLSSGRHSEERPPERPSRIGSNEESIYESKEDSSSDKERRDQDDKIRMLSLFPIDTNSTRNIIEYIEDQCSSTQIVPTHKTIVVEGFRDEVGDPRIVVHSCFGKGVNGLLGIVLTHTLKQRLNIDIQMLYNDNGILFRCSDAERLPLDLFSHITVHSAEQIILEEIPSSPLFGALFRQNAERSLLLLKGTPGKRRPFFLQRLKSADLLQIVRQYNDFPIVIETIRECLTDVLDFEHFKEIISKIVSDEIRIHTVLNDVPSPFASTLLFDFAAVYMYQWDDPKDTAKQQFASLNRELISKVVNIEELKTVVRADAVEKVEEQLQFTASTRRARSPEELMEILLRLGELSEQELGDRVAHTEFIAQLELRNIISPIMIGNNRYFILTEELPMYEPFSVFPSEWISSLIDGPLAKGFHRTEALKYVIHRRVCSHGTLTCAEIAQRFGIEDIECQTILQELLKNQNIVHGLLTHGSEKEQWCYRPNFERIHRASISILRKEIKPATIAQFTQLLLQWQHHDTSTQEKDDDGLRTVIEQFQGYALSSELWETEIFRSRLQRYDGKRIRQFTQRGEYFCVGTNSGRTRWIARGEGAFFADPKEQLLEGLSKQSKDVYEFFKENGASFLSDLREQTSYSLSTINRALSELFWSGLVTNDVVDEVLNIKRFRAGESELPAERIEIVNPRRNPLKSVAMKSVRQAFKQVPGWNGRWSLVHTKSILGTNVLDEEKVQRQAQQLLLRYGIIAREIAKREENFLPWSMLAMEFQRMEMRGEIRRGYFVEGLSGMQFAHPDAVRMLDEIKLRKQTNEIPIIVNACDPANPYGVGIELQSNEPFAQSEGFTPVIPRISRFPGNYLIFNTGMPIVWIENYGLRIFFPANSTMESIAKGLQQFINHIRTSYPNKVDIAVEYCNNIRPSESGYADMLRSLGFYRDRVQTMRLDLR